MKSWQDIRTVFDGIRTSVNGNWIGVEIIYIGNSIPNESEPTWNLKHIRSVPITLGGSQEWNRFILEAEIAGKKLLSSKGVKLPKEIQKTESNIERWLLYLLHKKSDPHSEISPKLGYTEGNEKRVRINNVIEAS